MWYEPVGYIIEYEIGALIIFLIIMGRYLNARRFPNQKNALFLLIMWATLATVSLDIISSLIIDNVFVFPISFVYLINSLFYGFSVLMLVLMMLFTLALTEKLTLRSIRQYFLLLLPSTVVLLLLIANPFSHWFFYVHPTRGYAHGSLFISIYLTSFVYLIFTLVIAIKRRARMATVEFWTVTCFLFIVFAATILQYFVPRLLATGVAIMVSVILMYFTIQNPDVMRDTTTTAFTYEAMLPFLRDCLVENKRTLIIGVKIENMSRINDLLGIDNGSLLLRKVSQFMRNDANDIWVFRMRGSTFVAITRSRIGYALLNEKLAQRISQPWVVNEVEIMLRATVCRIDAQTLHAGTLQPNEVVNYLESAFDQKENEKNRITFTTVGPALLERINRERMIELALREALETGEGLELYYQPLWSIRERRFSCAEVLLRFRHPVIGMIPPDEFVPIAESRGLVMAMDELVIRKAYAFLRDHDHCRSLGLESIEINLSALEFMQRRLPILLKSIMDEYEIDPSFLCFEITETAATQSYDVLKECMTEIKKLGCRFALDDFGTGYANISQVIQLPFSMVKLDKSMLCGPSLVLEDMAHMFAGMNCQTVVEGVETAEQAAQVSAFALDYIQGFFYAKPMSQRDFISFLQLNQSTNDAQ